MRRELGWRRAAANALFVVAALGLAAYGGLEVSRRHWHWQRTFRVHAAFPSVAGLEVGARVFLQGLDAGAVEAIVPPATPGGKVMVRLRVDERLRPLVRADATARIGTQGIVGAKVLELVPGDPDAPPLADGAVLASVRPRELSDLLDDAAGALARVDAVAEAARVGLGEIHAIAATINRGEGTLGRLVKEDEAYQRLVALSDRGEDALADLTDNLNALKRTWPFTRFYDRRGYEDIDRVLYQPRAQREGWTYAELELFEAGRAVLTADGQRRLDEFAQWFKATRRPRATEIVVAAFTDAAASGGNEDRARILTQDQAEAVKSYLKDRHKLHATGWFQPERKIAAVGFGTQAPRSAETGPQHPPRRVEIILFTPQA